MQVCAQSVVLLEGDAQEPSKRGREIKELLGAHDRALQPADISDSGDACTAQINLRGGCSRHHQMLNRAVVKHDVLECCRGKVEFVYRAACESSAGEFCLAQVQIGDLASLESAASPRRAVRLNATQPGLLEEDILEARVNDRQVWRGTRLEPDI